MPKKMRFSEDKYYNHDVIYQKGQIYEVPDNMVMRWLKRGGEIVEDGSVQAKEPIEVPSEPNKTNIQMTPPEAKKGPGRPKK